MTEAQEAYAFWKGRNRCVSCHKQDAYTLNGRAYCYECAERARAYNQAFRDRGGEAARAERRKREMATARENHVCTRCGKPLPKNSKYVMCDKHRAYFRVSKRAEMEKKRGVNQGDAQNRPSYGLCFFCGHPVKAGFSTYGVRYKVCDDCYNRCAKALERAQEVNNTKYGGRHVFVDSCMVTISRGGTQ